MDADLVWTALGTVATSIGLGFAWRQARFQKRSTADRERVAASTVVGVPVVVPSGRLPEQVRGRDDTLRRLRREFRRGGVVVLVGPGGVGKSTIAATVAERVSRSRSRVWWVSAADRDSFGGGLVTVARDLGLSPAELTAIGANTPDAPGRLWAVLGRLRRRWLLVVDNADDPTVLARSAPGARACHPADGSGWLRGCRRGLVLVTSRDATAEHWGRHARIVRVPPLADRDAAGVLTDAAPDAGGERDAVLLARRLGGLPLVLRAVGAYLRTGVGRYATFHEYRDALEGEAGFLTLASTLGYPADDDRAMVTRTWELSLDALGLEGLPQARPLLRMLSCLAPGTPIPRRLLDVQECVPDLDHCLARLVASGLIDAHPSPDGWQRGVVLHPVIADVNRALLHLEDATLVRQVSADLLAGAIAGLDPDLATDWPGFVRLAPHLHAVLGTAAGRLDRPRLTRFVDAVERTVRALNASGATRTGERLATAALDALGHLSRDDPLWLALRHELGWPLAALGRPAETEAIYREVLAARVRVLGDEHPETIRTRHELAWVTAAQGRWAEAEALYLAVLTARLRLLGPEHPDTLMTRHELCWVMARLGRAADAEPRLRAVSAALSRVLGPDHVRTVKSRHELAWSVAAQGRWAEAERAYRELFDHARRVFADEHPDLLAIRNELAWVLAARGDGTAALAEYRDVHRLRTTVLGADHRDTAATGRAIARLEAGEVVPADHLA